MDFKELPELISQENKAQIWDDNSTTDPKHTKKVNQRGGFTAIGAHYQIESMTRYFGAIGNGWGYDCNLQLIGGNEGWRIIDEKGLSTHVNIPHVLCNLTLWYRADIRGQRVEGKLHGVGACELYDSKWRQDIDAWKKAETDALTKTISKLGFNADVFLGLFDDNKYVQALEEQGVERKAPPSDKVSPAVQTAIDYCLSEFGLDADAVCKIVNCEKPQQITDAMLKALKKHIKTLKKAEPAPVNPATGEVKYSFDGLDREGLLEHFGEQAGKREISTRQEETWLAEVGALEGQTVDQLSQEQLHAMCALLEQYKA